MTIATETLVRHRFADESATIADAWIVGLPDGWTDPDGASCRWITTLPSDTPSPTGFQPNVMVSLEGPGAEPTAVIGTVLSDHLWEPPGDYSRRVRVVGGILDGRSFVEIVATFTSPGSTLTVAATAGLADWPSYADLFDAVVADVEPAPHEHDEVDR